MISVGALFPVVAIFWAVKLSVVIPLVILCAAVIILIQANAWRGRLSVPIYSLLALGAGAVAFIIGRILGAASLHGTMLGEALSIVFYLLVAAATGCFLALLFYRPQPQEPEHMEETRNE